MAQVLDENFEPFFSNFPSELEQATEVEEEVEQVAEVLPPAQSRKRPRTSPLEDITHVINPEMMPSMEQVVETAPPAKTKLRKRPKTSQPNDVTQELLAAINKKDDPLEVWASLVVHEVR